MNVLYRSFILDNQTIAAGRNSATRFSIISGLAHRHKHFPPLKAQKGPYFSSAFSSLTPADSIHAINDFYHYQRFASETRDEKLIDAIFESYNSLCRFFHVPQEHSRNFVFTDSCSSAISTVAYGLQAPKVSLSNVFEFSREHADKIINFLAECQEKEFSLTVTGITNLQIKVTQNLYIHHGDVVIQDLDFPVAPQRIIKHRPNIVLGQAEYMANIACWLQKSERENLEIRVLPYNKDCQYDLRKATELIDKETLVVSLSLVSNFFGARHDLEPIIRHAHSKGALVNVDAAQALTQMPINLSEFTGDFICFSGHKALGPAGVGLIYIHPDSYHVIKPVMVGDAGSYVENKSLKFRDDVTKFWSGVTATDRILGFAKTLEFVSKIGVEKIQSYNQSLIHFFREQLRRFDYLYVPSQSKQLFGLCSFLPRHSMTSLQLAKEFSERNIAISALKTSEFPFLPESYYLDSSHVLRLSVHLYNTKKEINSALSVLDAVDQKFPKKIQVSFSDLPDSVKKIFCPWNGHYISHSTYNTLCQKYGLHRFSSEILKLKRIENFAMKHFFEFSIQNFSECISPKNKKIVVIGCSPNHKPHFGTFLHIWAGHLLAKSLESDFVVSLNDIEGTVLRKCSVDHTYQNTSRYFLPLLNSLGISYKIVLRSQQPQLKYFLRTVKRRMSDSMLQFVYGRILTEAEKHSIAVMVAELLRYQTRESGAYTHVFTSYGVEEMPHILLANTIADKIGLNPVCSIISKQIIGRSHIYKMSKSRPEENLFMTSTPPDPKELIHNNKDIKIIKLILKNFSIGG